LIKIILLVFRNTTEAIKPRPIQDRKGIMKSKTALA